MDYTIIKKVLQQNLTLHSLNVSGQFFWSSHFLKNTRLNKSHLSYHRQLSADMKMKKNIYIRLKTEGLKVWANGTAITFYNFHFNFRGNFR